MGYNCRVFRDTEPFHEYLTQENLLSWVEFEQYRLKNEFLTHENEISIKTRKEDSTQNSHYMVCLPRYIKGYYGVHPCSIWYNYVYMISCKHNYFISHSKITCTFNYLK